VICPMCEGAGGLSTEEFVSFANRELAQFIERKMGAPPEKCIVGKSVDLRIETDVLELCDIVGGRWGEWAKQVRESRAKIQECYDKR
jgi:hypothetical protein